MKFDWVEYDRRRRELRFALLVALMQWLLTVVLLRLVDSAASAPGDRTGRDFLMALPPSLIVVLAHYRKCTCPCPACGRPIQTTALSSNALSRHCLHCGVPLGERSKVRPDDLAE